MVIDQSDQPTTTVTRNQGSDGKFVSGNLANKTGENGLKGIQRPSDRIAYLSTRYTPEEIHAFALDRNLRNKLPYWDSVYVLWMARSDNPELTQSNSGADDLRGERKELLDRLHGPVKQTTELSGPGGAPLAAPSFSIVFEAAPETQISFQSAEVPVTLDQATTAPAVESVQEVVVDEELTISIGVPDSAD